MMGYMVSFLWDSVAQANVAALVGEVVVLWFGCVDARMGKSDKSMLGEIALAEGVLVRRVVGVLEVSKQ